jgi:hypothetical protein
LVAVLLSPAAKFRKKSREFRIIRPEVTALAEQRVEMLNWAGVQTDHDRQFVRNWLGAWLIGNGHVSNLPRASEKARERDQLDQAPFRPSIHFTLRLSSRHHRVVTRFLNVEKAIAARRSEQKKAAWIKPCGSVDYTNSLANTGKLAACPTMAEIRSADGRRRDVVHDDADCENGNFDRRNELEDRFDRHDRFLLSCLRCSSVS